MMLSALASLEQLNYGNWSVLILLIKAQAYIPGVATSIIFNVQICTRSAIKNFPKLTNRQYDAG